MIFMHSRCQRLRTAASVLSSPASHVNRAIISAASYPRSRARPTASAS